jgi:hypothetical protein
MDGGETAAKPVKQPALAKQKLPPPQLQLQLEIEAYGRIISKVEKDNKRSAAEDSTLSIALNEVQVRKNLYDTLMGAKYEIPPEVSSRIEKQALVRMFNAFHGHAWARNAGWIGQPKVLKKPEVLLFEAESSVFEGVELTDVSLNNKKSVNVVTTIRFEGNGCTGVLPPEICDVGSIQNLNIQDNLISGKLPKRFSKLTSMKRLW